MSDSWLDQAKAQFTAAAQAVLAGDPDAERLCLGELATPTSDRGGSGGPG